MLLIRRLNMLISSSPRRVKACLHPSELQVYATGSRLRGKDGKRALVDFPHHFESQPANGANSTNRTVLGLLLLGKAVSILARVPHW